MKDVYRDVPHWRRLLPRERDVLTGRRSGLRDDKGEQQSQQPGDGGASRGLLGTGVSVGTAALVAAAVVATLAVGGLGARALLSGDDPSRPVATLTPAAPSPSSSVPAATAIQLEYSGGELVRRECTDASGEGECVEFDVEYDPLSVRCTASGCIVTYFGGTTGSLAGPLSLSGTTDAADEGCEETRWTLELTPVGEATTEGIRHPARLVGTATTSRPAERLPEVNCLGAEDVYRFDSTPS
jgi:hypothetical protein